MNTVCDQLDLMLQHAAVDRSQDIADQSCNAHTSGMHNQNANDPRPRPAGCALRICIAIVRWPLSIGRPDQRIGWHTCSALAAAPVHAKQVSSKRAARAKQWPDNGLEDRT